MMSSVYKDLDFVDMKRKIRLQPPEAEDLRTQLRADSAYLAKHDIIDYSFLVGIHHLHGETSESHKREWLTKNFKNLEEMYTSFKKECTSKTVVLTEDERQGQIGVEKSKYFAYFTWDDFVELAYTNHVSLCMKERLFESLFERCVSICLSVNLPSPYTLFQNHLGEGPEIDGEAASSTLKDGSKFANFHGGVKGSGSPTVYYLAIIDTLVPFQMKKKVGGSVLRQPHLFFFTFLETACIYCRRNMASKAWHSMAQASVWFHLQIIAIASSNFPRIAFRFESNEKEVCFMIV